MLVTQDIIANTIALTRETINQRHGGPFGACVICPTGQVFYASNAVLVNHDPTAHAEICAIRKACQALQTHDLTGSILYTTCMPCPMCLSATIWANIKEVYYGCSATDATKIGFRDEMIYQLLRGEAHQDALKFHQIARDEALQLFIEYQKSLGTLY